MLDFFIKLLISGARERADPRSDPRHPANLTIDYYDAESVLNAAARWDQFGDWGEAFRLYKLASTKWPDEHGVYVRNCVAAIQEKMALADGAADS